MMHAEREATSKQNITTTTATTTTPTTSVTIGDDSSDHRMNKKNAFGREKIENKHKKGRAVDSDDQRNKKKNHFHCVCAALCRCTHHLAHPFDSRYYERFPSFLLCFLLLLLLLASIFFGRTWCALISFLLDVDTVRVSPALDMYRRGKRSNEMPLAQDIVRCVMLKVGWVCACAWSRARVFVCVQCAREKLCKCIGVDVNVKTATATMAMAIARDATAKDRPNRRWRWLCEREQKNSRGLSREVTYLSCSSFLLFCSTWIHFFSLSLDFSLVFKCDDCFVDSDFYFRLVADLLSLLFRIA